MLNKKSDVCVCLYHKLLFLSKILGHVGKPLKGLLCLVFILLTAPSFVASASAATDYGDAPASYGSASVIVNNKVYLGTTVPDGESSSQSDYRALGDGVEEDGAPQSSSGVNLFPPLIETDTTYATPITVRNVSGSAATLEGWIDFNQNGIFDNAERTTVAVPKNTTGVVTLTWPSLPSIQNGTSYIRLKLSNASGKGEVEDHVIGIGIAIPPESPNVKVVPNQTPRACQSVIFSDNFDDIAVDTLIDPYSSGSSAVRNWTITGGGKDTYAYIKGITGFGSTAYFGNGIVRRIDANIDSGFSFDANNRLTTSIAGMELRTKPDDPEPNVVADGADWGPDPVVLSRSFSTVAGKIYRIYFTAVSESSDYAYKAGIMRVDTPVGSAHFKVPGIPAKADEGSYTVDYAVEFKATSASSTISFVNYGHFGDDDGSCNPQKPNEWCTVGGTADYQQTTEAALDNVYVVEATCDADYSDAPVNGTTAPDGSSTTAYEETSHEIAAGIKLGAAIDIDSTTITSNDANGEGADDDGITIPALTVGSSATIIADVSGAGGYLQGWIDWNGDGDFLDTVDGISEQIIVNAQDNITTVPGRTDDSDNTIGQISITVSVPASAITTQTFARFRWSTSVGLDSISAARDGEVEDYALTIANNIAADYGDAPASYGDASALVDNKIYLGAVAPDTESGSQHDYRALAGGTEEDGAPQVQWGINLFPVLVDTASSYAIPITLKNISGEPATLEGWIDFDHSGTFEADEKTTVAVADGISGTVSLSWPSLPSDIGRGTTFIRLRLTNNITGAGEVEDHVISIAKAVPPESSLVKVVSGETVRSCQAVVFEDDFDDLTAGTYLSPNRPGFSTIRDWTTTGGGADTYAMIEAKDGGNAVYLGNGMVRRVIPSLASLGGLSFDSHGRLTSTINAIELRSGADDTTPGSTTSAKPSSWGPNEVVFSRTFPSIIGKTYRLYFTGIPEGEGGGGYTDGMMRIDTPVGSAHFLAPGSNSGRVNYAIEFTATSTSSTIAIANYGHIGPSNSGWCNPQHSDLNAAAWCTLGGTTDSSSTNEVTIDDVYVVEAACDSDYSDAPANGNTAPDGSSITAYGEPSHDLVAGMRLGATIDLDSTSVASPNAEGDGNDDDGVAMPTLKLGTGAIIPVVVNQLAANDGYLQGWVDWNGDGDFLDSDEQIATNLQYAAGVTGTINISVTIPASAITSQTFARFRWSSSKDLTSWNAASDGEVEDYAVTIQAANTPNFHTNTLSTGTCAGLGGVLTGANLITLADGGTFGSTTTIAANTGIHYASPASNPYAASNPLTGIRYRQYGTNGLGWGEYSILGRGIDMGKTTHWWLGKHSASTGTEDIVDPDNPATGRFVIIDAKAEPDVFYQETLTGLSPNSHYEISLWVLNANEPGKGGVTDPSIEVLINGSSQFSSATIPRAAIPTWHRVGFTYQTGASETTATLQIRNNTPSGDGNDLAMDNVVFQPCQLPDYSDAPTSGSGYGEAMHTIVSGTQLGAAIDGESRSLANADASGDDSDDGITIPTLTRGSSATIIADVVGTGGYLQGWIDWNGDGDFLDTVDGVSEQISINAQDNITTVPGRTDDSDNTVGKISIAVSVPASAVTTQTFARFRWSSTVGLDAATIASDGEVEDYAVTVSAVPAIGGACSFANTTVTAIPNAQGLCTSEAVMTYSVADSFAADGFKFAMNIDHNTRSNLKIRLRAPNGQAVSLYDQNDSGADYNVLFDDAAALAVGEGVAAGSHDTSVVPYQHAVRPVTAFSTLNGVSAQGDWRLEICDVSGGDAGSHLSSTLAFADCTPAPDLEVSISVDDNAPSAGGTVIYTITASNASSTESLSGVVLDASVPTGLTWVSASASKGGFDSGSGHWTIGALAASESVTLTVTTTAGAAAVVNYVVDAIAHSETDVDSTPNDNVGDDHAEVSINISGALDSLFGCGASTFFNSDVENWRELNLTVNGSTVDPSSMVVTQDLGLATYTSTFGNPPGAITALDDNPTWKEFWSPDLATNGYQTDYSSLNGKNIEFQIQTDGGTQLATYVVLAGANGDRIVYDIEPQIPSGSNRWNTISVPLDASKWSESFDNACSGPCGAISPARGGTAPSAATFSAILSDLAYFGVSGEAIFGTNDRVSIDNIYVACSVKRDYSDGPATYGDAVHTVVNGVQLGATVTDETSAVIDADNASDDGVTIPVLTQGASATIMATTTGAGGYLQGWIDWNGDGDFLDTVDGVSEQIIVNAQDNVTSPSRTDDSDNTVGQISVAITVPVSAVTTQTSARFRWSTMVDLDATTAAQDGEVEDYALSIIASAPPTLGVCPSSPAELADLNFGTVTGMTGSGVGRTWRYTNVTSILGQSVDAIATVTSLTGVTDSFHTGGKSNGAWVNDPDGDDGVVYIPAASIVPGDIRAVGVRLNFVESGTSIPFSLSGELEFMDLDEFSNSSIESLRIEKNQYDGYFLSAGSHLLPTSAGSLDIFSGTQVENSEPESAVRLLLKGRSSVEFIVHNLATGTSNAGNSGFIFDGNAYITGACDRYDYSDAPMTGTAPDGTSRNTYGDATHNVFNALKLGAAIDEEAASIASVNAAADGADDDGIILPTLTAGDTADVTIARADIRGTGTGTLHAWIDFDGSGTFDAAEYATVGFNNGATGDLIFSSYGTTMVAGTSYARFRLSSDPLTSVDAATTASDGEVEDYPITIISIGVNVSGRVFRDVNVNGVNDAGEVGVTQLPVVLYNTTSMTCVSTRTNGEGRYQFTEVDPGNYQVYEASRHKVPVPTQCGPAFAKDPSRYRSTTENVRTAVTVVASDITDQDFGDVQPPVFKPNHRNQVLPGNVLFYAHRFSTPTQGSVEFTSIATGNTSTGWRSLIYQDSNCNGRLDGAEGNAAMSGTHSTTTWTSDVVNMTAGSRLCLINKIYAPANVAANDNYRQTITADFDYGNAIAGKQVLKVQDVTTAQQVQAPSTPQTPVVVATPAAPAQAAQSATPNVPATETTPAVPSTPYTPATDPTPAQAPVAATPVKPQVGPSRLELHKTVRNITKGTPETETVNSAEPGDTLEYRIYYRNSGTGPLTDLVVNDVVPPYTTLVGGTSCGILVGNMSCVASPLGLNDELSWSFSGALNGGLGSSVSYRVKIDD